jgi:hypothetical protein
MIEQFQHRATTSFLLWFDNYLLRKGEAFSNQTGTFFNYSDDRLDSRYKAYGSAYKQWVTDSSISNAIVPSGVYISGSFVPRGNNLMIDFENGRVLASGVLSSAPITGSFSVKDFNVYFSNDSEDDLIVERKYVKNSRISSPDENYISPYDQVVPAIFLSSDSMKNDGFAFGGMDTTKINMKAVILAENAYQLDGVMSIFADSYNENIPNIPFSGHPQTEYGDLKNGYYSYSNLKSIYSSNTSFFINSVNSSKLTDKARTTLTDNLYVGFLDFEIHQQRYPRQ